MCKQVKNLHVLVDNSNHIFQWNARSFIVNGKHFKQYIDNQREFSETQFRFVLNGNVSVRRDRADTDTVTFIREEIPYTVLGIGK